MFSSVDSLTNSSITTVFNYFIPAVLSRWSWGDKPLATAWNNVLLFPRPVSNENQKTRDCHLTVTRQEWILSVMTQTENPRYVWDVMTAYSRNFTFNLGRTRKVAPHLATRGGWWDIPLPPWLFYIFQYFEKILPLVRSLWWALQDEVYIMGCSAAGGLWRQPRRWHFRLPSCILPIPRNY